MHAPTRTMTMDGPLGVRRVAPRVEVPPAARRLPPRCHSTPAGWRALARLPAVRIGARAAVLFGALALGLMGGSALHGWLYDAHRLSAETVRVVVERIIQAESRGDPNAKNARSSALGAGQFIDATWLELIRRHRTDLTARSEAEILELRRDPVLAREITTRFMERNASILARRGLPVTPGTLYLSHFAGGAGAAAILTASADADAALIMARADATGRTSREKLIKANPFLEGITAEGLKKWADRKMQPPGRPPARRS